MSTVVISDTSPVRAMTFVGHAHVLQELFGTVLIPPAVRRELETVPRGVGSVNILDLPFVQIVAPANTAQVAALRTRLDEGKAEAIVLAIERHADVLLMDESDGRAVAERFGLKPTGVLGIFARAKAVGLIAEVQPLLKRLRVDLNFHVGKQLYHDFLVQIGETPE